MSIISEDINQDGHLDIILFGNMYGFEVETPRQDAGYGVYLEGNGKRSFKPVKLSESGLSTKGNVMHAEVIKLSK